MSQYKNCTSIKTIWGIAKGKELRLSDEELHLIVEGQTGKESIAKLNKREIAKVVTYLSALKDSVLKEERKKKHPSTTGNPATANQRKKIFKMCQELGWEDRKRLNGFCKRMFGTENIDWLTYKQCSNLIEALKRMLQRQTSTTEVKIQEDS